MYLVFLFKLIIMKAIVQRVKKADLSVDNNLVSEINEGLVVYLGVGKGDTYEKMQWMAKKVAGLRIFSDENGKMNLSAKDIKGEILVVSQFTLYGDIKNGYRPSFIEAEEPTKAKEIYDKFCTELVNLGITKVGKGIFGANMTINQTNSGPVTIILEK